MTVPASPSDVPESPDACPPTSTPGPVTHSTQPMCVLERVGERQHIVHVNEPFLRLTGCRREDLLGRPLRWLAPLQDAGWTPAELAGAGAAAVRIALRTVVDTDGHAICFLAGAADAHGRDPRAPAFPAAGAVPPTRAHEALLHEVNHRIRNNLQTISALIQLQRAGTGDPAACAALADVQRRIDAVGTACRTLYGTHETPTFDMAVLLRDVLQDLVAQPPCAARLRLHLEGIRLPVRQAVPLALICHEAGHALVAGNGGSLQGWIRAESAGLRVRLEGDAREQPASARVVPPPPLVHLLASQAGVRIDWRDSAAHRIEITLPPRRAAA